MAKPKKKKRAKVAKRSTRRVSKAKPIPKKKATPKPKSKSKSAKSSKAQRAKTPAARSKSSKKPARKTPKKPARKSPRKPAHKPKPLTRAQRAKREREAAAKKQAAALKKKRARDARYRHRKRQRRKLGVHEYAFSWLERIRAHCATVFSVALTVTHAGGGVADGAHVAAMPADVAYAPSDNDQWMAVGRFDPDDGIGYAELAHGLTLVERDDFLSADINPNRLSQIRIIFNDPNERRHEADSVLSTIGPWDYVISDQIRELVGASWESPGEDSLAARYENTRIEKFYVFFGHEVITPNDPLKDMKMNRSAVIPWGSAASKKAKAN